MAGKFNLKFQDKVREETGDNVCFGIGPSPSPSQARAKPEPSQARAKPEPSQARAKPEPSQARAEPSPSQAELELSPDRGGPSLSSTCVTCRERQQSFPAEIMRGGGLEVSQACTQKTHEDLTAEALNPA